MCDQHINKEGQLQSWNCSHVILPYVFVYLSIWVFDYLWIWLFVYFGILYWCICVIVHLSIWLFVYLCICVFVYLYIWRASCKAKVQVNRLSHDLDRPHQATLVLMPQSHIWVAHHIFIFGQIYYAIQTNTVCNLKEIMFGQIYYAIQTNTVCI